MILVRDFEKGKDMKRGGFLVEEVCLSLGGMKIDLFFAS